MLPTASLLCALEKDGYGRLVLLALGEADEGRCSTSGIGMEVRRLVGVLGEVRVVEDLRRSLEDDLRVDREDLCRFSRGSLSLSPSRVFDEGMVDERKKNNVESEGDARMRWLDLPLGLCRPPYSVLGRPQP